jgi:hypothetical protein
MSRSAREKPRPFEMWVRTASPSSIVTGRPLARMSSASASEIVDLPAPLRPVSQTHTPVLETAIESFVSGSGDRRENQYTLKASVARSPSYWPTPDQLQLLRASLLRGQPAVDAWTRWQAAVNVDRLDAGSQRLLPLLAHNLKGCGVRDPQLARFEGVRRYVWTANQLRVAQVAPLVRTLHAAAVDTMLLKGMALLQRYYRNVSLRHMDDVDLLVRTADIQRAVETMRALGWRPVGHDRDVNIAHSSAFINGAGSQVDLHWRFMPESCGADDDDELWERAELEKFGGTPVRVLGSSDLFLHAVVHGARWNSVSPVRWIADAVTILMVAGDAFDWRRLVALARRYSLVLPIRRALALLVEAFDTQVPAFVTAELDAHRASAFERVEQRLRESTSQWVGCFPLVLCHHVRLTRSTGPVAVVRTLPRFLQREYNVPSLGALPSALCARAGRRLRTAAVNSPSASPSGR